MHEQLDIHATIPYGARELTFNMSRGRNIGVLQPRISPPKQDTSTILRQCLERPIDTPPLRAVARGKRSAAILIPGKTRIAGTQEYLPALLQELNAGGIADENIEIFLATGTHEPHIDHDVVGLLGADVAARVRCVAHDCRDDANLETVGATRRGTPVEFNRRVLNADVKVLTGRVMPHYFAGYSGGRKSLLPGVAGFDTILANHRLTLQPECGLHPHAAPCSLAQNPVHLDMVEAAEMVAPDFTLNTMLNANRQVTHAVAGHFLAAHAAICAQARDLLRVTLSAPVDAVITSPGGQPADCNFMQSLKALFNIKEVVRPGGAILWVAECPFGIQPGFLEWAAIESDTTLNAAVRAQYALTGHNSLMLRELLGKVDIALLSSLPAEIVTRLGLHPVASLDEGIRWLEGRFAGAFTYTVAPHANIMCATLENATV